MSALIKRMSNTEKGQPDVDVAKGEVESGNGSQEYLEEHEVFKQTTDGVNFRTVKWPRASVIFLKSEPRSNRHALHSSN